MKCVSLKNLEQGGNPFATNDSVNDDSILHYKKSFDYTAQEQKIDMKNVNLQPGIGTTQSGSRRAGSSGSGTTISLSLSLSLFV